MPDTSGAINEEELMDVTGNKVGRISLVVRI